MELTSKFVLKLYINIGANDRTFCVVLNSTNTSYISKAYKMHHSIKFPSFVTSVLSNPLERIAQKPTVAKSKCFKVISWTFCIWLWTLCMWVFALFFRIFKNTAFFNLGWIFTFLCWFTLKIFLWIFLHVDYRIECGLCNKTSNDLFCHGFDGVAVIFADCRRYLKYHTKGLLTL